MAEKKQWHETLHDQFGQYFAVDNVLENFKISSHIRWRNVKLTNNQSEERRQIEIY